MPNQLLSTYSQGENRVTASILAVFERISFALLERILQALCQEPETALVTFENQVVTQHLAVPDARIRGSFAYWIETKIRPNEVRLAQIKRHLNAVDADAGAESKRLILLTPDVKIPGDIAVLADQRVAWTSFDNLVAAIEDVVEVREDWLATDQPIATESERVLLRELVRYLIAERLVGRGGESAVVVAARTALDDYQRYSAYLCQPNRSFQPVSRLAFYKAGKIDRHVPTILHVVDSMELSRTGVETAADISAAARAALQDLVDKLEQGQSKHAGQQRKVLLLSAADSVETLKLPADILNDATSKSGQPVAFTMGQRYVPLARLERGPKVTSELAAP